jgi:DNA polymerase-3 subunit delta
MSKTTVFSEIEAKLKKGKLDPIYFLYGREELLIEKLVSQIKEALLKKDKDAEINFSVLFAKDPNRPKPLTLSDIISLAATMPMFSELRLVVVKDFDEIKKESTKEKQKAAFSELETYLQNPPPTTILVLTAGEIEKKELEKEPYSLLKSVSYAFPPLKEADAALFAVDQANRYGWKLTDEAVQKLILFVGTSTREIDAEIRKIILYIGIKHERIITDAEVMQVVGVSKEYNIFELQRAVVAKDLRQSSGMILMMMEKDTEPLAIVGYLTSFFLKIWKLKQPEIQKMASNDAIREIGLFGNQAYYFNDYKSYADRVSTEEIENAILALGETDLALKGFSSISGDERFLMLSLMKKIIAA